MSAVEKALFALSSLAIVLAAAHLLVASRHRSPSYRVLMLLFPVSQLAVVALTAAAVRWFQAGWGYSCFVSLCGLVAAVYDPLLFRVLAEAGEREAAAEYARTVEGQLEVQREHLARMREAGRDAEEIRVELAGLFGEVRGALDARDPELARTLLRRATDVVPPAGASFCRNPAVDALLASKLTRCRELGVELNVQAGIPMALPLPDLEVCAVLSNLIDNAVDAVRGFAPARRWVRVVSREAQGYLVVAVENPADRAPQRRVRAALELGEDGRIPEHGWGISIVEGVARRHAGAVTTSFEDGVYTVRVLLHL